MLSKTFLHLAFTAAYVFLGVPCAARGAPFYIPKSYEVLFTEIIPTSGTLKGLSIDGVLQVVNSKLQIDEVRDRDSKTRTVIAVDFNADMITKVDPFLRSYIKLPLIDRGTAHHTTNNIIFNDGTWEEVGSEMLNKMLTTKYRVQRSVEVCDGYRHIRVPMFSIVWLTYNDHLPIQIIDGESKSIIRIVKFTANHDLNAFVIPSQYREISGLAKNDEEMLQNIVCP